MEKYQSLIVDYLYYDSSPDRFRAIASDNYSRQVLIDQMIDVSVNLKGEERRNLSDFISILVWTRIHQARALTIAGIKK